MKVYRTSKSWRATFDSGLRHVLVGLVPATSRGNAPPRMVALPAHRDGSAASVDPLRVFEEVTRALADIETATGVAVHVEAIEYVPNDSPYYEKYYSLAYNVGLQIVGGE